MTKAHNNKNTACNRRRHSIMNIMLGKGLGGIEQAFINYCIALKELGYTVINVIHHKSKIKHSLQQLGLTYIEISVYNQYDIFAALNIRSLIKKHHIKLIIAHGGRSMALARMTNTTTDIIGISHNYSFDHLRSVDYAITITEHMKQQLISTKIHPPDKITVIPNFLPTKSCHPPSPSLKHRSPITIGIMSRLVKKKGIDIFLATLANIQPNCKVIIAGDGPEKKNLEELIKQYQLANTVSMIGWVEDKHWFYNEIDILCVPSLHEPFGIVLIEAMSYGKVVVSSDTEGPTEIIQNNINGILFDTGNQNDLHKKLSHAITNYDQIAPEISQNAISTVNDIYTLPYAQNKLQNLVLQILSNLKAAKNI